MKKKLLIIIYFLINIGLAQQTGSLIGTVTDGTEPIPFVNILFENAGFGTSTDVDGNYKLTGLKPVEYSIRFSAVGYQTKYHSINISAGKTLEFNVVLNEITIEMKEVEVTGISGQQPDDTRTSLIDVNPRSAKILPGAVEDVFRTLQTLPGVLAPNDFSSQLIIRGSGPDQNLIIMDDVEIFNPYRLYGVISMFNPEAVSDINLITGGFPAKYGDRLSAVLDVTNREGSKKDYLSGNANVSIVDANLVLEGKNPFNINGSWFINSRRTYYDLIVEPFVKNAGLVDDNVSFPNFYDVQGKFVFGPFNGHKFLFNGIYSRDGVDVVSPDDRETADSIGVFNETKNDVASFAWHYTTTKNVFNKVIVSWYRNSGLTDFNSQILDPSLNRDQFEDAVPDTLSKYLLNFKFNADFSFVKYSIDDKFTYLWNDNVFEAGAGVDFMTTFIDFSFDLDPQLEAIISSNPRSRSAFDDINRELKYERYRAYIQNNFAVTEDLFINPGLRFDYYNILNKAYAAPRLSLSYALDGLTTLRAVWGMYFQSPGYEKAVDQNILYDLDKRYTTQLNAEQAIHYVLGVERWLTEEWNTRAEVYYKDFSNLIIPKSVTGTQFYTEQIPGKDQKYRSGWTRPVSNFGDSITTIPVNASFGEAYGLELFLSKKNISGENKLSGWISYSFAYANRYEDGIKLPFRFDQRHTVNIVLNYKINNWLDAGIRWQYGSGFPISEAVGIKPRILYVDTDLDGVPDSPEIATRRVSNEPDAPEQVIFDVDYGNNKLNSRKPAYHRLDVRFTAYTNFWNLDWTFYLDVINAYNRSNVIGYDYYVTEDLTLGRETSTMFPIIPTLGFSVRF